MTKVYIYQTPLETYHADRRKAHDPKYLRRTWYTDFETEDYNEILEYINGQCIVTYDEDDNPLEYNTPEPVYRVLEQNIVVQEGELVSPYDIFQKQLEEKMLAKTPKETA